MQTKVIDTRNKEVYFNPTVVEEQNEADTFVENFWSTMNMIAYQNIAIQQVKFA